MQKISQYLYSNRIELLADLATFNVEFTNVYQRPIKIYKGVDNVLEFDIKNADQKRLDLINSPEIDNIKLNVIDASGYEVGIYDITPQASTKGIATATIPSADLENFSSQFFGYSVTCDKGASEVLLYGDTRFSGIGTLELVGPVKAATKENRVYQDFTAEIDLAGLPISKSSVIPATFYEAVKTIEISFDIDYTGFKGKIWLEGTTETTITAEAFKPEVRLNEIELLSPTTGTYSVTLTIGDYKYFRIRYQNSKQEDITGDNPMGLTGTVDKITVS